MVASPRRSLSSCQSRAALLTMTEVHPVWRFEIEKKEFQPILARNNEHLSS
jgi:hypothetical protein